jgi:hypothetical protein
MKSEGFLVTTHLPWITELISVADRTRDTTIITGYLSRSILLIAVTPGVPKLFVTAVNSLKVQNDRRSTKDFFAVLQ